jgi:hypothetical protein
MQISLVGLIGDRAQWLGYVLLDSGSLVVFAIDCCSADFESAT